MTDRVSRERAPRKGDFSQVSRQVVQEATRDSDEVDEQRAETPRDLVPDEDCTGMPEAPKRGAA